MNSTKLFIMIIILLIILLFTFDSILYIIITNFKKLNKFFNKNKTEKKENINNTYNKLVFNKKISKLNRNDIEKALNIVIDEKKNETDEYHKLLIFFWGVQLAFIVASTQLLINMSDKGISNIKLLSLSCISFINYIASIKQLASLGIKEGKIVNYLYHIAYLEYYLNINVHTVIIQDKNFIYNYKNPLKGLYGTIHFISFIWEVTFSIVMTYNLYTNYIPKNYNNALIVSMIFLSLELSKKIYLTILNNKKDKRSIQIDNDVFAIQLNTFIKK